jgi:hypothetical protein
VPRSFQMSGGVLTEEDALSAGEGGAVGGEGAGEGDGLIDGGVVSGVVGVGRTALRQSSCTRGRCQRRRIREGQPPQVILMAFHVFTSSRCCPFAV